MSMVNHGRVVGPVEAGMIARAAAARARLLGVARKLDAPVAPPAPVVEPVVYQQGVEQVPEVNSPRRAALSIVRAIAKAHGVTTAQVLGMGRMANLCAARHEAIYAVHVTLGWSLQRTGRLFSDRDHTTALHSVKAFTRKHPAKALALIESVRAQEARDADGGEAISTKSTELCEFGGFPARAQQ